MFKRIPKTFRVAAFFLLLGSCGVQIARTATAAPVTQPLAKDAAKAEREAVSRVGGVDVRAPMPEAQGDRVGGNGVVEPAGRETKVAAQVSAVIDRVLVKEGQWVKAGEPMVELASGAERAALAAAEADLAAERANLARALKGVRVEEREAAAAEAQAAKARAELSAGVLARLEKLARSNAATADELDRARQQAQADQASYQGALARSRAAEVGSRPEDIAFARARSQAASARKAQAEAALERLTVRAPADGEVLQLKFREGELYAQGGEPLVVMGDTRHLRVRMDVDERDIAKVKPGARATVLADAFGGQEFAGRVVEIGRRFGRKNVRTDDPVEKNDTKVLEVVLELDGQTPLVPGQRVTSFVEAARPAS